MTIKSETNANAKLGAEKAAELIRNANKLVVMKGRKITTVDLGRDKPSHEDLLAIMLGTTGNLRAPTLVRGKTVLVGFNAEIYDEVFG